jgi:Domain of unknown function (DUF6046)
MTQSTTIESKNKLNNPSRVLLNGVKLPDDVIIGLDGDKRIAESKILDGVAVFECVGRDPFKINFEFTCREQDDTGKYIFPQNTVRELAEKAWRPDQVIPIENTFLNRIGILNVVLKPISFTTIRGNTDVICSIKAEESPDPNNSFATTLIYPGTRPGL